MAMKLGIDACNLRDGGGVTHLVEMLRMVDPERDFFSEVVVWGSRLTLDQIDDRSWLTTFELPPEQGFGDRFRWQWSALPKAMRLAQCDLLFAPGGLHGGNFHPVVTMCRNMLPFSPMELKRFGWKSTRVRLTLLRFAQARAFRSADGLIFLTQWAKLSVEAKLRMRYQRATIVPHGISDRFRRRSPEQLPAEAFSANNPFRLLYVSVVAPYKHQSTIAEAVARLRSRNIPIAIDFVGPSEYNSLQILTSTMRRLDPMGEFLSYSGPASYLKLHAAYHSAHAFVFASSCENMPNILVEAMSAGLPIMCSKMGPMPEILGDGGLYFDPFDLENITAVLHRIFRDRGLRERCSSIAAIRSGRYSWKRCAEETFSFLAGIARRS